MSEPQNPFTIDDRRLDRECLQQAQLSRAAGEREADARHAHAQAKAAFDVACARLQLAIRAAPVAYKLRAKPTKDEVDAAIILQPEYTEALLRVNEAKYALDLAAADVSAHIDRRKMIERRVELLAIDWHAEREPRPVSLPLAQHVGPGIEYKKSTAD